MKTKSKRMIQLVREWQASGVNCREFCESRGVSYWTFQYWRRKFSGDVSGFTELRMASGGGGSGIEIRLSSGIVIVVGEGFNPVTLREVVAVLSEV